MLEKVMQQIEQIINTEFQKRFQHHKLKKTYVESMKIYARQQPWCNPVTGGGGTPRLNPITGGHTGGTSWRETLTAVYPGGFGGL